MGGKRRLAESPTPAAIQLRLASRSGLKAAKSSRVIGHMQVLWLSGTAEPCRLTAEPGYSGSAVFTMEVRRSTQNKTASLWQGCFCPATPNEPSNVGRKRLPSQKKRRTLASRRRLVLYFVLTSHGRRHAAGGCRRTLLRSSRTSRFGVNRLPIEAVTTFSTTEMCARCSTRPRILTRTSR